MLVFTLRARTVKDVEYTSRLSYKAHWQPAAVGRQLERGRPAPQLGRSEKLREADRVGLGDEGHTHLPAAPLHEERRRALDRGQHRPLAHLPRLGEGPAGGAEDDVAHLEARRRGRRAGVDREHRRRALAEAVLVARLR